MGALEQSVVIVAAESVKGAHAVGSDQVSVDHLGSRDHGVVLVTARFGFQDAQDIPAAVRRAIAAGLVHDIDLDSASYFLSRARITLTHESGMAYWQKKLYLAMAQSQVDPADEMSLPGERTVVIASEVIL